MEWAGVVPAVEAAPEPPASQPPPTSAAPAKRRVREHHEECDEALYEGGNCTCWSIELVRAALRARELLGQPLTPPPPP